jgi:hypothetical protein
MKFSGISALGGLVGVASAQGAPAVCNPSTVTVTAPAATVTVTAPYNAPSTYGGAPVTYNGSAYKAPPYVTTAGPTVTSVDYGYSQTSVWVYPTGNAPSKDCIVAVYEETFVTIIIINISTTIINGQTTTIYSTVSSGGQATTTPSLPPPPPTTTSTYIYSQPPSGSSSSSASGATRSVVVGADGALIYKENGNSAVGQLNAAIGDIIAFDFNSTNHTVTQSSFAKPCEPLAGGFSTGFDHVNKQNHTGVFPPVNFTVTVSTPLWFYCAQTVPKSHCHAGMVLGVNPAGKFPAFLSMATASSTSVPLSTGTGGVGATSTGTGGLPIGTGSPARGPGPVKFTTPGSLPSKRADYWAA